MAVMSKNYMDSKFCRGELEMALYRSKTGRDCSLLVVTLNRRDKEEKTAQSIEGKYVCRLPLRHRKLLGEKVDAVS